MMKDIKELFSIIGMVLISIVLMCLAISYYCYKRYLEVKFHGELKGIEENDSSMNYQFIQ